MPYTFHEYQVEAEKTANFQVTDPLLYCIMGAAGEAGETLEKIKKLARKHATYNVNQFIDPTTRNDIIRELGDQLWYIAIAAKLLGLDLSVVAKVNIEKLADRQNRGVIIGAGDDR